MNRYVKKKDFIQSQFDNSVNVESVNEINQPHAWFCFFQESVTLAP